MNTISLITRRKLNQPIQRQGFTLVELLVSMAIIIFMLSIMSQAFVIATTCMQGMKTVGELIDKVRPVMTILQRDLAADHFDGTKKLCDQDFWEYGPPREGYFSIIQGGVSEQETPSSGSVKYYISNSANSNHTLTFTSRLPGKNPTEFYTAEYPSITSHKDRMNGIFNYPNSTYATNPAYMKVQNARRFDFIQDIIHCKWAELAYFIRPNGNIVAKDPTSGYVDLPLHDLYRQQRVILPDVSDMNKAGIPNIDSPNLDPFNLFSHYVDSAGKVVFNQPSDVTAPWKRFGNRGSAPSSLPNFFAYSADPMRPDVGNNSDLILTNVISFDVRIINDSNLDFLHLYEAGAGALSSYTNYNVPYADTVNSKIVFDTWTMERSQDPSKNYDLGDLSTGKWQPTALGGFSNYKVPFWNGTTGIKINAIQITIRVWDDKSSQARDFVLIQKI
jgi:prepilin-type N-terminal cleavage/methylation domain-containing protein